MGSEMCIRDSRHGDNNGGGGDGDDEDDDSGDDDDEEEEEEDGDKKSLHASALTTTLSNLQELPSVWAETCLMMAMHSGGPLGLMR